MTRMQQAASSQHERGYGTLRNEEDDQIVLGYFSCIFHVFFTSREQLHRVIL